VEGIDALRSVVLLEENVGSLLEWRVWDEIEGMTRQGVPRCYSACRGRVHSSFGVLLLFLLRTR
jgi:hypothetical protein